MQCRSVSHASQAIFCSGQCSIHMTNKLCRLGQVFSFCVPDEQVVSIGVIYVSRTVGCLGQACKSAIQRRCYASAVCWPVHDVQSVKPESVSKLTYKALSQCQCLSIIYKCFSQFVMHVSWMILWFTSSS